MGAIRGANTRPARVFFVCNYGVLPAWALLALAPGWPWTQRLVHSVWIPALLTLVYGWALVMEHSLHTHMEVQDGVLTGRVVQPICFGEGKIYWLQQLIESEQVDLARSYFYTDSITDVPLLDLVGHPVVVNPDPLLYRHARRRRWPVRYFRPPPPTNEPKPLKRATT